MEKAKVCLITGASSGIGYAIADMLRKEKEFQIVVTARREGRLKKLESDNVKVLAGDLNSIPFLESLENFVYDTFGTCDYLFNCAGMIEAGTIEKIDIDRMTSMIRLNTESTFRLTYMLLKRFKKQGFGHIINISSVLGTKVRPTAGAYAATKFAMEALSEALRLELIGSNIQVSCIEPGLVLTELHDHWETHPKESLGIHVPLSVDDVVQSVKYILAQPEYVRVPKLMILPKDHNI